ncbi:MAG: transcription antitermination factor NusB [Thalassobaculales bacterium]
MRGTARRSVARLNAAQALYQLEMTGTPVDRALADFITHDMGRQDGEDGDPIARADARLMSDLVRGAWLRKDELDGMIAACLAEGWTLERLELVMRAILRAGCYEMTQVSEVPAKVIINEYVDLTHAFFAGKEPAFVNAVLDRVARLVRPEEMGVPPA